MKFKALTVLILIFSCGCAGISLEAPRITATIAEYGLYSTRIDSKIFNQNTPSGQSNIVSDIGHVKTTNIVPMRMGQSWGFRYILEGYHPSQEIQIEQIITHPPIQGKTESKSIKYQNCGKKIYSGWTIETEDELIEGDFTWKIIKNGETLLEKTFTIKKEG